MTIHRLHFYEGVPLAIGYSEDLHETLRTLKESGMYTTTILPTGHHKIAHPQYDAELVRHESRVFVRADGYGAIYLSRTNADIASTIYESEAHSVELTGDAMLRLNEESTNIIISYKHSGEKTLFVSDIIEWHPGRSPERG